MPLTATLLFEELLLNTANSNNLFYTPQREQSLGTKEPCLTTRAESRSEVVRPCLVLLETSKNILVQFAKRDHLWRKEEALSDCSTSSFFPYTITRDNISSLVVKIPLIPQLTMIQNDKDFPQVAQSALQLFLET